MAIHWDYQGNVDGYVDKLIAVLFGPVMMVILALILINAPEADPLKKNILKIRGDYNTFLVIIFIFLTAVHIDIILWSLNFHISPIILIAFGLGLILFYIGKLFEKAERNWTIGIRTPWTMSSDSIWQETHALGAKLFKAAGGISFFGGLVSLFGFITPEYTLITVIGPIILFAIYLVVYSYNKSKDEKPKKKKNNNSKKSIKRR